MPEEEKTNNTFLITVLVLVILITLSLAGALIYTKYLKPYDSKGPTVTVAPVITSIYEGYIQELSQKEKTIDGTKYTYVVGLLDQKGNSLPVWITEREYNSLKLFDTRNGRQPIALSDVKGGMYMRLTRTIPTKGTPEDSEVVLEIQY